MKFIPKRYLLVLLLHLGAFLLYATRSNLSIAMVAMVADQEDGDKNVTKRKDLNSTIHWNKEQQQYVLSGFFFGYIMTNIPGGILSTRIGGKLVFGVGICVSSILTLATPVSAQLSFYVTIAVRFGIGLVQGIAAPVISSMIVAWFPHDDRSVMLAFTYAGVETGTIVTLSTGGLLCASRFLNGWPSVFYLSGTIGVIWSLIWFTYVDNQPKECDEILYCQIGSSGVNNSTNIPWLSIISSLSVFSLCIVAFTTSWVWFFFVTDLPEYYADVLRLQIVGNGLISMLPYIVVLIIQICIGLVMKKLSASFNRLQVYRCLMFIASVSTAIALVLLSSTDPSSVPLAVFCTVWCAGMLRVSYFVIMTNLFDISPNFIAVVAGYIGTFAALGGVLSPIVTGYLVKDNPSKEAFRKVFLIQSALSIFGGCVGSAFVKGERQKWDYIDGKNCYDIIV